MSSEATYPNAMSTMVKAIETAGFREDKGTVWRAKNHAGDDVWIIVDLNWCGAVLRDGNTLHILQEWGNEHEFITWALAHGVGSLL